MSTFAAAHLQIPTLLREEDGIMYLRTDCSLGQGICKVPSSCSHASSSTCSPRSAPTTAADSDDEGDLYHNAFARPLPVATPVLSTGLQTTVLLRNLPNSLTRTLLMETLNNHGFGGSFDFMYLPVDFQSTAALGYAFVNFISEEEAARCKMHFHGFSLWTPSCKRPCDTSGSVQHHGLDAHVERYRNSQLMNDSVPECFRPAVFARGSQVQFPAPTRPIPQASFAASNRRQAHQKAARARGRRSN